MTNKSALKDLHSKTTAPPAPGIERTNGRKTGLYVQSRWQADRFHHTLGLLWQGQQVPVLISCEGGPDDIWPPSPPLQQLHSQLIDDQPALLAVGMAGTSHFSSSFLLAGEDRVTLIVQLACRLKTDVSHNGSTDPRSTYQLDEKWQLVDSGNDAMLSIGVRSDQHESLRLPQLHICCDGEGCERTTIEVIDKRRIQMRPAKTTVDRATQWTFNLSWDSVTTTP